MNKGIFITFEGGEGTGKSTQVKLLQDFLVAAGVKAITTREPGGTDQAEKIRSLLVQRDGGNYEPLTEALLLFAGRHEHVVNKIRPALEKGEWVISDRFADSTRAMQGNGLGLDQKIIEQLYDLTVEDMKPDLTFVLDIDPEVGLKRSKKSMAVSDDVRRSTEDRYERMSLDFHKRLRQGFLDVLERESERCILIDATQGIDTMHARIVDIVEKRFSLKTRATKHG